MHHNDALGMDSCCKACGVAFFGLFTNLTATKILSALAMEVLECPDSGALHTEPSV